MGTGGEWISGISVTTHTSSLGGGCFVGDRALLIILQALFPQLQGGRTLGPLVDFMERNWIAWAGL